MLTTKTFHGFVVDLCDIVIEALGHTVTYCTTRSVVWVEESDYQAQEARREEKRKAPRRSSVFSLR